MTEELQFIKNLPLEELQVTVEKIKAEIGRYIVGQHDMIDLFILAILADGHVLIEGMPGIAKTLTSKLMAKTVSAGYSRIQFTPDLMPSDVLGTSIYNMGSAKFEFNQGPIFSNIILIDEINRAPAKTQSALFEVMEEKQVTIDGTTYKMTEPFLVFATQNPIEQEGTYQLPEAQLDRFMFKIEITYPTAEEEFQILMKENELNVSKEYNIEPLMSVDKLMEFRYLASRVHADEKLIHYISQIVSKTRSNKNLFIGASPRASIAILNSAKANAAVSGRDFLTPEDVKKVAYPVLKHRIQLTPEKEMEGMKTAKVVEQIIESVEIPR